MKDRIGLSVFRDKVQSWSLARSRKSLDFRCFRMSSKNTITTRITSSPMTPTHEVRLATINIHLHIHVHLHILQCWPIISLSAPSIVAHILGNILFKDTSVSAPELCFRLSHSDLEASVIEISESPTMEIGGWFLWFKKIVYKFSKRNFQSPTGCLFSFPPFSALAERGSLKSSALSPKQAPRRSSRSRVPSTSTPWIWIDESSGLKPLELT